MGAASLERDNLVPYAPRCLEKLSEKGSEQRFDHACCQCRGTKVRFLRPVSSTCEAIADRDHPSRSRACRVQHQENRQKCCAIKHAPVLTTELSNAVSAATVRWGGCLYSRVAEKISSRLLG